MKRDEFDRNIVQLLRLLKKILKHQPGGAQVANFLDQPHSDKLNINLCFVNFMPISSEELDELEEACEKFEDEQADGKEAQLSDRTWTQKDVDFLKRNGIQF